MAKTATRIEGSGSAPRLGLRWVLVALVLLTLVGWLALRGRAAERRAERAFAMESGSATLQGLAAPVEVLRDARGIPHIAAVRERDAWVALGFVHAQDRLAQMLWLRRLARGRTAEVIGERGLPADRMARTLGIGFHAEAEWSRMQGPAREVLIAYAEGVTARIERIRSGKTRPPLELAGAAANIEDWQPADCIAILKLIAWSSSNLAETGMVLDDLIERLGSQLARPFRPTGVGVQGADIPSDLPVDTIALAGDTRPLGENVSPSRDLVRSAAIRGGTAFVLSGRHTESGAPILVADLHLPPSIPSLVHEIHLRGGGVDVAGATIPGMPVVWAGRNLHVAWAATPAQAVSVDLYKETLRESAGLYQNGSRWVPIEERTETIKINAGGARLREEEWRIRWTRHGPLINPLLRKRTPESDGSTNETPTRREPLALAWTGMLPGDGLSSLLDVARARDSRDVRVALERHHEPVLMVVYSDDDGDAGRQMAGWLPQRTLPTSLVPVPGRLRLFDWRDPIDFSALPALRIDASRSPEDPSLARSWMMAADGPVDVGLGAAGIEWMWRTGERARRLEELLTEMTRSGGEKIDLRAAAAIQTDRVGGWGPAVIPALLRLVRSDQPLRPEGYQIAQLLSRWDGDMGPGNRAAAAYQILIEHLTDELFRGPFGDSLFERYLALPGVRPTAVVASVILAADESAARGGWADVERVRRAARNSLRRTWVSLSYRLGPGRDRWSWGRLHTLELSRFVGFAPSNGRQGRGPAVGVGGDETTLATTAFERGDSYRVDSAATFRLAVDLAAPDRMLSTLAPGQSEHPGHLHYDDGLMRWSDGRPSLLLTSRLLVEEESASRLLLEPGE